MRNNTVRIAKYSYIDKNINFGKHIHADLKNKSKNHLKTAIKIYLLFFLSISIAFFLITKFYNEELSVFLDKINNAFVVSEIDINGHDQLSGGEIRDSLGLSLPIAVKNIDVANIKNKLKQNLLIKEADIKIIIPNRLILSITERKPNAIWLNEKNFHLIDKEGFILKSNIDLIKEGSGYIIAAGYDANKKFQGLIDELQYHNIFEKLFAAQLISDRRWNILLKDGLIIKLPENGVKESLIALDVLLKNYKPVKPFSMIDLRLTPSKIYATF